MDGRLRVHIFGNGTENTEIVMTASNKTTPLRSM